MINVSGHNSWQENFTSAPLLCMKYITVQTTHQNIVIKKISAKAYLFMY